mgnify:CR=1 FL=1
MADRIQGEMLLPMKHLAEALDGVLNGEPPPPETWKKRWAFVLLTAEFGVIRDGRVNYISNGEREDMVAMLRELLARFEGQPYQEGRA